MRQPLLAGALLFNTVQSEADQWNDYRYDHPLRSLGRHPYIQSNQKKEIISFFPLSVR
ncbi:hypothetical protein GGR06_000081 [Bacteroides reticulotermitis]|uniref:Uncharacterized protein n=1 Tax=Bacteroides reticulotermitis TaxID=1133319 RepID=A0A840D1E5_9BACE|nr:hypothetical protein [Bacteroides reticulotermitis]